MTSIRSVVVKILRITEILLRFICASHANWYRDLPFSLRSNFGSFFFHDKQICLQGNFDLPGILGTRLKCRFRPFYPLHAPPRSYFNRVISSCIALAAPPEINGSEIVRSLLPGPQNFIRHDYNFLGCEQV